jgi:hypothetical protein
LPDVVISEFMDEAAVDSLRDGFEVLYDPGLVDRTEDLKAALGEARALVVRNRTQVTAEVLAAAPRLQVVGRLGVGLDNIDLAACEARDIKVCPATGANDLAVAEYVVTTALLLLRGAYSAGPQMLAGAWPRQALMGREASGKTLTSAPLIRPAFARTSSAASGFFFCGMIEDPVENRSLNRTNRNCAELQITISSASRLRCTAAIAAAPRNSSAKSRSLTASSEFAMGRSNPSAAAVISRSMGKLVPASAAAPSGLLFIRARASRNRPRSRSSIST